MDHREGGLVGFGWEVFSEHLAEETVHDGVQPSVDESIPVLSGLPHVDVAQATFRALDGKMDNETLGRFIADLGRDYMLIGRSR